MGINAVCIHGHFYQPPREDPLSGLIPDEQGAEPFHNWNERIHHECYKPNAILGNFEKVSFNIGPTLFEWIESYDPATYQMIIEQENSNYRKYGVGNGMAQAYNHVILPLANPRDKETQIKWGIADFKHRFGHQPLGLWLPETAVDLETLTLLSDNGIKFTILAPWQISDAEKLKADHPYLVELPGGREPIVVFIYHQGLSTSVSFHSQATRNADEFLDNWVRPIVDGHGMPSDKMLLIASDGELYGHHKKFRELFLSHMLNGALHEREYHMTYPGLWLLDHFPKDYVTIVEDSSWSCHHGVVRWKAECNCTPGASWKAPLRSGLDQLAEKLDQVYENYFEHFTSEMWALRNKYIHVILGEVKIEDLLKDFIDLPLSVVEVNKLAMLLAAQYERQRIFTSCGWFFDHFHRIEPQNNIAYAAQAVWLTYQATGISLKESAIEMLKAVKDQRTGLRGDTVFSERYQRSQDFSEDNIAYFNPSSSFST